jgi:glycosyltransferase involved in cell wall biosynthesis
MVIFTGELENPFSVYKLFNLFLLTSREDPFPLVALESAWYHKPVICFDKGTGTAEFVKKGTGIISPYMDINTLADNIEKLRKDKLLLKKLGDKAHNLVEEYDINNIGPKIHKTILNLL